jgi:hypothetical protein
MSSASFDSGVSFSRITLVRFLKKLYESITVTIVSLKYDKINKMAVTKKGEDRT